MMISVRKEHDRASLDCPYHTITEADLIIPTKQHLVVLSKPIEIVICCIRWINEDEIASSGLFHHRFKVALNDCRFPELGCN